MSYYKNIHYMTQEIANYSVEEVNNMYPFEIEVYAVLKKQQLEREAEARKKAKAKQNG